MAIPFVFRSITYTSYKRKKTYFIWWIDWNDQTYVKEKVLPKLSDREWLQSLPPNTVGGHLGNLLKIGLWKNFMIKDFLAKKILK